ncbi:lpha-glucanase [Diaporthe amygdali]|uniref:lpha-glucanase n=1 Tax=Phomopsis amygdali TaxID=1214568 RepID=UPI0022FE26BA|nr:lpha-glucanase [Diaporthe amygdali]KAJ0124804.1 lpha-glucanase [Diaporthe amygdali]
MESLLKFIAVILLCVVSPVVSRPSYEIAARQTTDRLVFCHFMIGIVSDRTGPADFDADMQRAKALGIDAFALNIGVDPYTDAQLSYAYQSAANNGMKVFISFDFNWYHTSQGTEVGQKIAQYATSYPTSQLYVDGKIFASSFAGDGVDVNAIRTAAGAPIFWAPNFHPSQGTNFSTVDGALNWMAWPNNGNNKAPTPGNNVTVEDGDQEYITALAGKPYIAPVSPWFSTHFGPEVPYSKNWVFPGDLLWYQRWNEILTLGPRFLEIITWNDYGESHYIGPLASKHTDDGNSKWTNDMPHGGWMDMAKPFISAYKNGATSAATYVSSDQLIYWYRPTLRSINCDATDTTMVSADNSSGNYFMGRPNGYETLADAVFVVSMLKTPGTVTVMSGNNVQSFSAPAGISAYQVDMQIGKQQFFLARNGQTVMSSVSLKNISDVCPCGIYNFNAYVGSVPDEPSDPLGPDALASLTAGLHPDNDSTNDLCHNHDIYLYINHDTNHDDNHDTDHDLNHNLETHVNYQFHHEHHPNLYIYLEYYFCNSKPNRSLQRRHRARELCRSLQLLLQLRVLPSRAMYLYVLRSAGCSAARDRHSGKAAAERGRQLSGLV